MNDGHFDVPVGAEHHPPPPAGPVAVPNVAGGVLVAGLAAAAGAVAWYLVVTLTGYQIGYLAIGVGALVGLGAKVGAGRVGSRSLQAVSVALAAAAMIAAEYFVARFFAVEFLATQGVGDVPLLLPLGDAVAVVQQSVSADPLTLAFWAIALVAAWRLPGPARSEVDMASATA